MIHYLEDLLRNAVIKATRETPLRPNAVETFDEYNTGDNTGTGAPSISWSIIPDWDGCAISTYLAGGGCSLPGHAAVLMPGEGYEGVSQAVAFAFSYHLPLQLLRFLFHHQEEAHR